MPSTIGMDYGKTNQTGTSTTRLPGMGGQEQSIIQALIQMMQGGMGQLGDLSGMAQGQMGGPSQQDLELVRQSIGGARQMAESQLAGLGSQMAAQGREQLTGRGMSGSSAEVLGTLLNQLGTQNQIGQSVLQAQQQGGQALMQLPFQRGQMQLSANQALFDRIMGSVPAMQNLLQTRLAQPTTSSEGSSDTYGANYTRTMQQ